MARHKNLKPVLQPIVDISNDKMAVAAILSILTESTAVISSDVSFGQAIREVLKIVCDRLALSVGFGITIERVKNNTKSQPEIVYSLNGEPYVELFDADNLSVRNSLNNVLSSLIAEDKTALMHNILVSKNDMRARHFENISSEDIFSIPVCHGDNVIAILQFIVEQPETESKAVENLLLSIANQLSLLLSHKYIEKSLNDHKLAIDQANCVSRTDLQGRIIYVNQTFCELFGYKREQLYGMKHSVLSSNLHDKQYYRDLWSTIQAGKIWKGELKNYNKSGQILWLSVTIVPYLDDEGIPYEYFCISNDITDRKSAELRIQKMAYYDDITSLPNRRLFQERLDYAIKMSRRNKEKLAVVSIDIDNFKRINDSLGHEFGDKVLEKFSARLEDCLRTSDSVSRKRHIDYLHEVVDDAADDPNHCDDDSVLSHLGGDEFTVMLTGNIQPDSVTEVLRRLQHTLCKPIIVDNHEFTLTMSMGVSMFPDDGENVDTLIKNADSAVHYAKQEGKQEFRFYNNKMNRHSERKLKLEHFLRHAIEDEQLEVFYQPVVDVANNRVTGHEALLRWHAPIPEPVYPDEFIALAEESNLICEIGEWVMKQACQQTAIWHAAGYRDLSIAVNVAMRQFKSNIIETTINALSEAQLPANYLDIEITETGLMSGENTLITTLKALSDLGVSISVDDFGTGYSSLRYLQQFPIDALKIDRSFIMNCPANEDDLAISKTIISLAKMLNLSIIAEGVETRDQLKFLAEEDCDYCQGFMFSRPVNAAGIEKLMNDSTLYKNVYLDNHQQEHQGSMSERVA